ncbi:MAG: LysR family transcriptional regulator [Actinomycetia bacterium]|nr:LysR family transcriptional regulator [Actinomycetes bacterium]
MEWRHLEYFRAVVRHGGFSRAAEAIHVAQPTLTKAVQDLERATGTVLLDRSRRPPGLTDAGAVVLRYAEEADRLRRQLDRELADLADGAGGRLAVGLPPMVGSSVAADILARFHRRYPGIALALHEVGSKAVEAGILAGELDVGFAVLPVREPLRAIPVWDEPLAAVMAADHPLARREAVSWTDLDGQPLLLYREDYALHDRIREECRRQGVTVAVVGQSSQWDVLGRLAGHGLGLALLPRSLTRRLAPGAWTVRPLVRPALHWTLGVVWDAERYQPFALRRFLATLTADATPSPDVPSA